MPRSILPMTTATGMGPMPALLEAMAGNKGVQRVFQRVGVPLETIDDRDTPIPLQALVGLFDEAARETGNRMFGIRVGENMSPGEYGLWTLFGAGGQTLKQALNRIVRTQVVHQSGSYMTLRQWSDHVLWTYHPPGNGVSGTHHSDHITPVMIRFVRQFLGADWVPSWVHVDYRNDGQAAILRDALQTNILFGADGVTIAIPAQLMATPRPDSLPPLGADQLTSVDLLADAARKQSQDPVWSIRSTIALRLRDGDTDIEGLAKLSGSSTRTIQRILSEAGTTYRDLLGRVKIERASALLIETDTPVTDIALSLGYSDPANFTRAFRRGTGWTPKEIRAKTAFPQQS